MENPCKCGNGILEPPEQCDDGNVFSSDGCSSTCQLEDPSGTASGSIWKCTTVEGEKSTCCRSLVNPITSEIVCTCAGQDPGSTLFTVTPDCNKVDVDECETSNGGCHIDAICQNLDGTQNVTSGRTCFCGSGMRGDGIVRCDLFVYQVTFAFVMQGVLKTSLDSAVLETQLIDAGILPAGTSIEDVHIVIKDYYASGAAVARRLLQAADSSIVTVYTEYDTEQAAEAAATQTATDYTALSTLYDTTITQTSSPTSQTVTADSAFGGISTTMGGFVVDSVVYNSVDRIWEVMARYNPEVENTVRSLYVSKGAAGTFASDSSFYISMHPCMKSSSVCCLLDYDSTYVVGSFGDDITASVGTCDASVQAQETSGMFDPSLSSGYVENVFQDYPLSSVQRISPTQILLRIHSEDLQSTFAKTESIVGGTKMEFFVGMAYYTLLPASAISTSASQVKIELTVTNGITFSFATQQDSTVVKYVSLSLYQNRLAESALVVRNLQFARVGVVLPTGMSQNTNTGLIPVSSIRFAVATSLPAIDSSEWINPCMSTDSSGIWDVANPWRDLYQAAKEQSCALQSNMCMNPATTSIGTFVEFNIPIGDNTINATHFASSKLYYFFAYFDISLVDSTGKPVVTKLSLQAPITELSITRACESVTVATSLLQAAQIDLAIGLVGTLNETEQMDFFSVTSGESENSFNIDSTQTAHAKTMESALTTLVIRGDNNIFNDPQAATHYIGIDAMTTLHFLDETRFRDSLDMLAAGNAFSVIDSTSHPGHLAIRLSTALTDLCNDVGNTTVSCAIRREIVGGELLQPNVVKPMHSSVGVASTDADAWINTNLLGNTEFAQDLSSNFVQLMRTKYDINDRYNLAWMINPAYNWPRGRIALSDRMLALVIFSLRDSTSGSVVTRRLLAATNDKANGGALRSLLQTSSIPLPADLNQAFKDALDAMSNNPTVDPIPAISYDVNVADQVGEALDLVRGQYGVCEMSVVGSFKRDMSQEQILAEIERRMKGNLLRFCPTCKSFETAFFNLKKKEEDNSRRRLLQSSTDTVYEGTMTVAYVFGTSDQKILFDEMYRSLIDEEYATVAVPSNPSQVSSSITSGQLILLDAARIATNQEIILGNSTYIVKGVSNDGYTTWNVYTAPPGSGTGNTDPVHVATFDFRSFLDGTSAGSAGPVADMYTVMVTVVIGIAVLFGAVV